LNKIFCYLGGLLAGILNGMLGAGGGMIVVPTLKRSGLEGRNAHATSIFVILCLCVFSASMNLFSGKVEFADAVPYILSGVPGALVGTAILSKINQNLLKKIFGLFLIFAGLRMLFQ